MFSPFLGYFLRSLLHGHTKGGGGKISLEKYGKRRRIREYFSPSLCRVAGGKRKRRKIALEFARKKGGKKVFFTHFLMRQTHMCMDLAWRIYPQCAIFSGSRCACVHCMRGVRPLQGEEGEKAKLKSLQNSLVGQKPMRASSVVFRLRSNSKTSRASCGSGLIHLVFLSSGPNR